MYLQTLKTFLYFGKEEAVWALDIVWVKANKNISYPNGLFVEAKPKMLNT